MPCAWRWSGACCWRIRRNALSPLRFWFHHNRLGGLPDHHRRCRAWIQQPASRHPALASRDFIGLVHGCICPVAFYACRKSGRTPHNLCLLDWSNHPDRRPDVAAARKTLGLCNFVLCIKLAGCHTDLIAGLLCLDWTIYGCGWPYFYSQARIPCRAL